VKAVLLNTADISLHCTRCSPWWCRQHDL